MAFLHLGVWWQYALWNLAGFGGALVANSFVEWAVHRWIMHKPNRIIPYGYLHMTSHHATFGSGRTYVAIDDDMLEHGIAFTWREYVLFPAFCLALYAPVELLVGRPLLPGALLAVFVGLVAFDALHSRFHAPKGSWLERTRVYRFLNRHHQLHHERVWRNFNVVVPLADLVMGTLVTEPLDPEATPPV